VALKYEADAEDEPEIDDEDGNINQTESNRLHRAITCCDYSADCKAKLLAAYNSLPPAFAMIVVGPDPPDLRVEKAISSLAAKKVN
jgi:hypothetical protein